MELKNNKGERIVFQIKIDTEGDIISYASDELTFIEDMAIQNFLRGYLKLNEKVLVEEMDELTKRFD